MTRSVTRRPATRRPALPSATRRPATRPATRWPGTRSPASGLSPPGGLGLEPGDHPDRVDRRDGERPGRVAGGGHHHRRCPVAQPEARAAQPRRAAVPDRLPGRPHGARQVPADRLRAGQPAGDVVADVRDERRPRVRGEQGIERRHAIRLGRGHGQPLADVVECRRADPADPRLDGVERRQQLGPARPDRVAAAGSVAVDPRVARPSHPARPGWAQHGVNGSALRRGGERPDDVEVHRGRV